MEYEKHVKLVIGAARLIPEMYVQNPYAVCSYQAFSELSKMKKELEEARMRIAELEKRAVSEPKCNVLEKL